MNEEGGIYRESFHLTWTKIMGFSGAKKSQKAYKAMRPTHHFMWLELFHAPGASVHRLHAPRRFFHALKRFSAEMPVFFARLGVFFKVRCLGTWELNSSLYNVF